MKTKFKFSYEWTLILVPILLATGSLATLYSITSISGKSSLVLDQAIYFGVSVIIYLLISAMDYKILKSLSWYGYILGIILLVLVEILGQSVFGSTRWINLGFFQFQPSELMKVLYIIFAASYFSTGEKLNWRQYSTFFVLSILPLLLILKEPDLGTALVIFATLAALLLFLKLPKKFYIFSLIGALLLAPVGWYNLRPYQKSRITSFVNPEADPRGAGYNVSQSKITVGSGGLFGKGFSGATQSQLQFLPVAHVDFIFSGWAEATGFLGSSLLVFVFCLLIYRIFIIAGQAKDRFGYLFASMAGGLLTFQVLVNVGMNIGLMPVTGIPLPLFSYGGTSVIVMTAMIAIIQSIYLRRKALRFD